MRQNLVKPFVCHGFLIVTGPNYESYVSKLILIDDLRCPSFRDANMEIFYCFHGVGMLSMQPSMIVPFVFNHMHSFIEIVIQSADILTEVLINDLINSYQNISNLDENIPFFGRGWAKGLENFCRPHAVIKNLARYWCLWGEIKSKRK